ncbi:MAG: lipid II flippase MurJ [Clostridia bacterium]|nr:lipid II flippase MurJ [Clostridia bacterium]
MAFYSVGLIGIASRKVLVRAFYSIKDTKTPMVISSVAMATNILLNIALSNIMGINGIALATSLSSLISMFLLYLSLGLKIGNYNRIKIGVSLFKITVASLLMGISVFYFHYRLAMISGNILSLFISIVLGSSIYFILIIFMRVDYVKNFISDLKKRFTIERQGW